MMIQEKPGRLKTDIDARKRTINRSRWEQFMKGGCTPLQYDLEQMCPFRERVIMPTEPARIGWR